MIARRPASSVSNVVAFVHAFERGSFTAAAKALHVTPAAVSRSIGRLEESLRAPLFRRTTRHLAPTEKGRAFYARCTEALALLAEAERSIDSSDRSPRGKLRISVPTTYGLHRLLPRLGGFTDAHPGIDLEIHVSNQTADFVREGFDLAIRMGTVEEGLVARRLGEFTLGVFASPAYVRARGAPKTLDELAAHAQIAFVLPRSGRVLPWSFATPTCERVPAARLHCVEDPRGAIALCVAGEGLFQTYHFMVERELERGELVEVLERHAGRARRFSIVYPKEPRPSPAARAFIEFVLANVVG